MPASTAASSVARASSSFLVPYQPTRPMQPKPRAGTRVTVLPMALSGRAAVEVSMRVTISSAFPARNDRTPHDHRLSRTLHHRAAGAHRLPRCPDRRAEGPGADTLARLAEDQR